MSHLDTGEGRHAGAALPASEDLLRLFVEHVPAPVAMFDRDMRYIVVSRRFLSDYRLPREVVGRSHYDVFPELPERWKEVHRRCLAGAVESCDADPFPRSDGTLDWVRWEIRPWRTSAGEIGGIILFSENITERKRSAEALRESEERFKLLVQGVKDYAIYMLAPDGTVKSWSSAAQQIFGYREEEIVQQPRAVFYPEEERRAGRPELDLADAAEVGRYEAEGWRVRRDGSRFWANVILTALRDDAGNLRGFANVTRDFTERRKLEAALRESEGKYVAIFDKAAFGIALTRLRDRTFVTANDAFLRLFGFTRDEVIGKTSLELGISDPDSHAQMVRELAGKGALRDVELWRRTRSGAPIALAASLEQVTIGGSEFVLTTVQDITERKRAEEALRASEERLRLAQLVARVGTFEWDPRTNVSTWTRELEVQYGLPPGEFPRNESAWVQLVHPDDRAAAAGFVKRAFETGTPAESEWRVIWPDGSIHWLAGRWQVLKDASGAPIRVTGISLDVTPRKRAEEALEHKRAELETILDRTPFMLTRCTRDLRYRYVSRAYAEMLGRAPGEIAGKPIVEVMGEKGLATIRPHVDAVLRGELVEYEDEVHFASVGARLLHVIYVPDRDERGQVVGWIANILDVTERRQAATLRAANEKLLEADRQRTAFLAMLSHELRNPLAPISYSLYALDHAPAGGEQARRAQTIIARQVGHLTRLVDDLLDVTRITKGKIQLQRERVDLSDLVRRAVEDHRSVFVQNDVQLDVRIGASGLWMNGDRTRLAQAVGNLLQNAAKFTPHGGRTTVTVAAAASRGEATVTVSDTGSGITPEMIPRLFRPFVQADATLDRSKGGLGLGLALVRGLVEMHGGSVSLASGGPGKGATFTIRLPIEFELAREMPPKQVPRGVGARRRVLVIEDNEDAANTLREVLEMSEHVVEVAYGGRAGVEKARVFRPDVVLCDIGLPEMDGYEVARAIRADPQLSGVALVAVSGYAQPEDVELAQQAGFTAHLAKPPSVEAIERVLAEAAQVTERRSLR